ncbi:MAG: sulfotransferase [Gomphosphaeria aponina SAG 52.96 = DSM 107014]|uniref:Sulfotransferase n=1 Tax=Gomphosphaeria aponina SAG 52.96 = DSM 107014 TaxID=1521640 RepID=A0A941GWJ5_9CHRO|nr:sulfotransferase [Gomphosphaeria aponina SAG 52.96 = DSM 107014]
MVAGTLKGAGYFMGEQIMRPTKINPKGYFESKEIEAINEDLLTLILPPRPRAFLGNFFKQRTTRNQRWLAKIPVGQEIPCPQAIATRIELLTAKQPFCFKDPRFCYTLPAWQPFLKETVFICVFRHPAATAASIMNVHAQQKYLHNLALNYQTALKIWQLMYQHILQIHRHQGQWLFIHYNQVLTTKGLDRIEAFIKGKIDRTFPDLSLGHAVAQTPLDAKIAAIYAQLCALAKYQEE